MGIPLYSPLFPEKDKKVDGEGFITYNELAKHSKTPLLGLESDSLNLGDKGIAFFNTKEQLKQKITIAKPCAGFMFWEITQDVLGKESFIRFVDRKAN
jgi:hypothetical protein